MRPAPAPRPMGCRRLRALPPDQHADEEDKSKGDKGNAADEERDAVREVRDDGTARNDR